VRRCFFSLLSSVLLIACAEGVVDTSDDPSGPAPQGPQGNADGGGGVSFDASSSGDDAPSSEDAGTQDAAQKDGSPPSDAGTDAQPNACQASLANAHFDFESGTQGWTHDVMDNAEPQAPGWPFDVWGQGIGGNTLGCHAGSCYATSPSENYVQCGRAELRSPQIDLSKCTSAASLKLTFQHAWQFWTGSYAGQTWYDGGVVEISGDGGKTWQAAPGLTTSGTIAINPSRSGGYDCVLPNGFYVDGKPGFVGASSGWQAASVDVPAALRTSQFMVRFAYASGVSSSTSDPDASKAHTGPGWHVDDVAVTAQ
jgi:hypothetical protein